MRKTVMIGLLFCLPWQGAFCESDGLVDYLKLTRENLPQATEIMAACERTLELDMESSESYNRRARFSALLPRASIGYNRNDRSVESWGYVDPFESGTINGLPATITRYQATGYEDQNHLYGGLTWRLSDLVIHRYYYVIENTRLNHDDQRHFLLNDLSRRYSELWLALPEKEGQIVSQIQALKVMENAGIIDAWSGGGISRVLAELDAKASDLKNGTDALAIIDELKEGVARPQGVVEVDDGQSDKLERVGPKSSF